MVAAPKSRRLTKLDAAIAAAANPIKAKCVRAERAALLARQGQLEAAKAGIDELGAAAGLVAQHAAARMAGPCCSTPTAATRRTATPSATR